jgi:hypothetical protein
MNRSNEQKALGEMELKALEQYLYDNDIAMRDYINPETMGILEYTNYVDLYYQAYGECFECQESPCDEGCLYQVNKKENKQ